MEVHMMRIIEAFTKEHWRALESAFLTMMDSSPTHEAMTSTEE
jgi:hypothetical protein